MAKSKNLSTRGVLFVFAAVLAAVIIGVAATAHAEDRDKRGDRDERGIRALVSLKTDIKATDSNVRVANDSIRVNGAKVTATSTAGFTATTGTPLVTFNVQTDSSTKFSSVGKGKSSLAELAVGDTVNFRGLILSGTTTSTLTVKATHVEGKTKHPSPPKPLGKAIVGTVSSVSVTGNALVISGKATTTVTVNSSTKIVGTNGTKLTLAGIPTGNRIKAVGSVDTSTNVFTATKLTVGENGLSHDAALKVIARLEAFIAKLKLRFGLYP